MIFSRSILIGVQFAAYLVGGLGAWLVVRAPAMNPAAVAKDAGPRTRRRGRAILWLILAGLMATSVGLIANWLFNLQFLATASEIPTSGLLVTLGGLAGVVVGFLLAWLLFRRIRWAEAELATGWRPSLWQRLFLFLALGPFLTWPITVPVQIAGILLMMPELAVETTGQAWVGVAQAVIGYGLGLLAAGIILRRVAGRHARFFESRRQLVSLILLLAVAGMLAQGVVHLFDLFNQILQPILPRPEDLQSSPLSNPASAVPWILNALSILAYLIAVLVVQRIDWDAVEMRSGWRPSGFEETLGFLTLAAWLAWPFDFARLLLTEVLPLILPGFTLTLGHVVVTAVAVVVLYLTFVYSPGGAHHLEEPSQMP